MPAYCQGRELFGDVCKILNLLLPCKGRGWEWGMPAYCQGRELFGDVCKALDLLLPLRRGRLGGGKSTRC
ncbi:Uncharacterised protein [Hafnia alvei]|nr:Uncharacterised protein [Hafnia alvei]